MLGVQYALRNVPRRVNAALRRKARQEAKSLDEVAPEALVMGVGLANAPVTFHDLDVLAGTWREDAAFGRAIAAQDKMDTCHTT